MIEKPFPSFLWCTYERKNASDGEFTYVGRLLNQKTSLSSTNHWAEALGRFCIAEGGVVAAVSVFVRLKQLKNYKYWDGNAVYLTHVQRGVWGKFCDLTRRNPLATFKRNPYENSLWACKNLSDQTKLTNIVMKPLLRHFRGQHDLKTVFRSSFRPEMAEK